MFRSFLSFLVFLAAVALIALVSSLFVPGEWYAGLKKPPWNPPSWVFAPVWAVLYFWMALAASLVWSSGHRLSRRALAWWLLQLLLNGAWSLLFFGLHRTGWALAEMAVLLLAIKITSGMFRRIKPLAAGLMMPYMVWVSFAWCLNLAIWLMNGGGIDSILN